MQRCMVLRKRHTHGFLPPRVLVRTFATQRNLHYRITKGTGTDVSIGRGELLDPLLLIRCHDNEIERPVQPPLRGAQPFYPDVYSAPLRFDQLPVPFADGFQVELAAIAESKARPEHPQIVRSRINA